MENLLNVRILNSRVWNGQRLENAKKIQNICCTTVGEHAAFAQCKKFLEHLAKTENGDVKNGFSMVSVVKWAWTLVWIIASLVASTVK